MSICFEILVRIASYGPQIDQSHGENRLSHIIRIVIPYPPSHTPLFKKCTDYYYYYHYYYYALVYLSYLHFSSACEIKVLVLCKNESTLRGEYACNYIT